eukprot:TRINITY_DN38720_c0_g1_i1.p1 TRINITY_DN38720_c0_g1~~TRINITY_DN38720_c0_g1_i1.p1  ORF type:complete len:534 (+),score=94.34 TRINITY_DN38720_c0_g1_i1:53-1603(+)
MESLLASAGTGSAVTGSVINGSSTVLKDPLSHMLVRRTGAFLGGHGPAHSRRLRSCRAVPCCALAGSPTEVETVLLKVNMDDTLSELAQAFNTTAEAFVALNHDLPNPDDIMAGMHLKVPADAWQGKAPEGFSSRVTVRKISADAQDLTASEQALVGREVSQIPGVERMREFAAQVGESLPVPPGAKTAIRETLGPAGLFFIVTLLVAGLATALWKLLKAKKVDGSETGLPAALGLSRSRSGLTPVPQLEVPELHSVLLSSSNLAATVSGEAVVIRSYRVAPEEQVKALASPLPPPEEAPLPALASTSPPPSAPLPTSEQVAATLEGIVHKDAAAPPSPSALRLDSSPLFGFFPEAVSDALAKPFSYRKRIPPARPNSNPAPALAAAPAPAAVLTRESELSHDNGASAQSSAELIATEEGSEVQAGEGKGGARQVIEEAVRAAVPAMTVGAGAAATLGTGWEGALTMIGLTAVTSFAASDLLLAEKRKALWDDMMSIRSHQRLLDFLRDRNVIPPK